MIKGLDDLNFGLMALILAVHFLVDVAVPIYTPLALMLMISLVSLALMFHAVVAACVNRWTAYVLVLILWIDTTFSLFTGAWRWVRFHLGSQHLALMLVFSPFVLMFCVFHHLLKKLDPRRFSIIFCVFLGVTLLGIALRPLFHSPVHSLEDLPPHVPSPHPKPNIYLFFFDGHGSLAAFPKEIERSSSLRDHLERDLAGHGFLLFPGAFANYPITAQSMASMFNGRPFAPSDYLFTSSNLSLQKSRLFETIMQNGYQPVFLQSHFIDFCRDLAVSNSRCYNAGIHQINLLGTIEMAFSKKVSLLFSSFFASVIPRNSLTGHLYERSLYPWLQGERVWPLLSMRLLQDFQRLAPRYRSNTFLLVSLMLPHWPYAFTANCDLRDHMRWSQEMELAGIQSEAQRLQKYEAYLDTVACLHQKLGEIFSTLQQAGLYDSATIILLSDHGSRIGMRIPKPENAEDFQIMDFWDYYSTFLAVKPGLLGREIQKYQPEVTPAALIVADLFGLDHRQVPKGIFPYASTKQEPFPHHFIPAGLALTDSEPQRRGKTPSSSVGRSAGGAQP